MKRYTPKEAAAELGFSYQYFLKLMKDGVIQYHRISERRAFLTEADIAASVDAGLVRARKAEGC